MKTINFIAPINNISFALCMKTLVCKLQKHLASSDVSNSSNTLGRS